MLTPDKGDPPNLIYCPERSFDPEEFIDDTLNCIEIRGYASIVVSEGIKYADGRPVSALREEVKDKFGNTEYGAMGGSSAGMMVHRILTERTGLHGEFQITESLPMCAIDRARVCGKEAVRLAMAGDSGVMVTIVRQPDGSFSFGRTPLSEVAVRAKTMPPEMINERGNDITDAFLDYVAPWSIPWISM